MFRDRPLRLRAGRCLFSVRARNFPTPFHECNASAGWQREKRQFVELWTTRKNHTPMRGGGCGKEQPTQPKHRRYTQPRARVPTGCVSERVLFHIRYPAGYTIDMRKVLVSLPETDLRVIDAAARKAGETRSSFVRRAALAEAHRVRRPIDDPAVRGAFERLMQMAERRDPISTAEALEARDRGRR